MIFQLQQITSSCYKAAAIVRALCEDNVVEDLPGVGLFRGQDFHDKDIAVGVILDHVVIDPDHDAFGIAFEQISGLKGQRKSYSKLIQASIITSRAN